MFTCKFSHARTALKYGMKQLDLKAGDIVLIPEYICDVVLHPLQQLNLQPRYYPVKDDLSPDWSDLRNLVDNTTKALLMVHYFGQPQRIDKFRNFCDEHNLFLIEDNAHGHGGKYNGHLLGTFGDVGFSSPRKVLGLNSIGILYWNGDDVSKPNIPNLPEYPIEWNRRINKFISRCSPSVKRYLKKTLRLRPPFEDPRAFREPMINDYYGDSTSLNGPKGRVPRACPWVNE